MAVIQGAVSGNLAEVDATNRMKVNLATSANPNEIGSVAIQSENDTGSSTGEALLRSPETDGDYRLRVSQEMLFDSETINYTAQNTGKHRYTTTTMTNTWTTTGLTTNSGNITTVGSGTSFSTYAEFPILGASALYCEIEGSFNAQPVTSSFIEYGLFRPGGATPFAPTDGVSFRLSASGLLGIVNYNGSETQIGPFLVAPGGVNWTYNNNQKYQFIIVTTERSVEFWIDGVLYGTIDTPTGQGQPIMSTSLPFALRHAIAGGTASAALSFSLNDYTITLGGPNIAQTASVLGQRIYGSYQGLSGGTMGSLATYPNSTIPTNQATPTNISLAANLPGGLGGQGSISALGAAATDFILGSFQVPAGTTNIQGRRLVLRGVLVDALNLGAPVATTATAIQWSLAFGHTAASLATAEAVAGKAARRVGLGFMTWPVAAAIGAAPQGGRIQVDFGDAPIFINPGEFVAIVGRFVAGTATASQTILYNWQPTFGWE